MADNSFLKHFITEPVYVIPGEVVATSMDRPQQQQADISEEKPVVKPEITEEKKISELIFKGSNKRNVLVIVDQPAEEYINAGDESFLGKVLGAIKLNINDIAIVNFPKNNDLNKESLLKFNAGKYLIFGVEESKLFKDNLPPYQIIEMENSKQVLNCASLSTIANDPTQKKLLWAALQKMFL